MDELTELQAKYNRIISSFVLYAEHRRVCESQKSGHIHLQHVDQRVVCDANPCTCGLIERLQEVMPHIHFVVPCSFKRPLRFVRTGQTLFGLPVYTAKWMTDVILADTETETETETE